MRTERAHDLAAPQIVEPARPRHYREIALTVHDDEFAAWRADGLADAALDLLSRNSRLIGRTQARGCLLTDTLHLTLTKPCEC